MTELGAEVHERVSSILMTMDPQANSKQGGEDGEMKPEEQL